MNEWLVWTDSFNESIKKTQSVKLMTYSFELV